MKNKNVFVKVVFIVLIILLLLSLVVPVIFSQTTPKKDTLLNGLKVLMFSDPRADKVHLKVRIHAGSAFDPQGKEGLMQILADNLFPTDASREFFAEDLDGGLEVVTNYDYIQVNASAKPDQFLTMLETIAGAVSNPPIDKENTARLKNVLAAKVKTLEADPEYVADQAVAKRLFGTFPYGRPQFGTETSLEKIDFADLIDARQRFLTADNATIAISGNFDRSLALRAIKRYFGGWLKSDKRVPSTFRQPDDPDRSLLAVASPRPDTMVYRVAIKGVARADKELGPALVFASILENRLQARFGSTLASETSIRNDYFALPGIIAFGFTPIRNSAGWSVGKVDATALMSKLVSEPVTEAEFQTAKKNTQDIWAKRDAVTFWLDADTYKIAKPEAETRLIDSVTLADVTAFSDRTRKLATASVIVATPAQGS